MTSTTAPDPSFWNFVARKYAAKPVANPDAFQRKIAVTRGLMREDDVVLDIGCGTGSLALELAPSAARVHGLDFAREMVDIAREKARAAGASNVTFECTPFDANWQGFEPESLDGICAYNILHLVPDRPAMLAQIHQLLRPGGYFVSSTACLGESWVPYHWLIAVMRMFGRAPAGVANIRKAELTAEMTAAGFEAIEQPDVGADAMTAFVVARKPGGSSPPRRATR